MFPNLLNFPLLNFSPLFNSLYGNQIIPPWIGSETYKIPVSVESSENIA
jgi:hypothetical protein